MAQELSSRIQDMFKTIYECTDKQYLRPMKRTMFKCGHDCLDDKNDIKKAERCIEECGQTMHKAMVTIQNEINTFQGRIDRCLINCQDDVRNESDESKARKQFDSCASSCVNQYAPTVTEVAKTLCEKLDKIKREASIS